MPTCYECGEPAAVVIHWWEWVYTDPEPASAACCIRHAPKFRAHIAKDNFPVPPWPRPKWEPNPEFVPYTAGDILNRLYHLVNEDLEWTFNRATEYMDGYADIPLEHAFTTALVEQEHGLQ